MKKIYTYLTLLAGASVLILSSCTREVVPTGPEKDNTPAKVRTEVVGVKTESDETKVTLEGTTFAWQDGDAIAVWTGTTNTSGSFQDCTVSEGKITVTLAEGESRKNYAVYPASVKDETYAGGTLYVKLPASYAHTDLLGKKTPLPMVANNTESSLTFYNVAGLLRVTVKAIPNTATGLVFQFPGNKVNGTFAVDNPGTGTSSIATGTPGIGEDKITVTFPANTATEMTLNIPLPTGAYDDVYITPVGGETKVASARHIKAGGYTANRARGRQLTATLVSFSVSAEKKVIFSPGNLQATYGGTPASWSWHFADHQYDFIGNGGESTVGNEMILGKSPWISGPGTVDLFSFSSDKDGNYYGIHNNPSPGDGDTWSLAYYGSFKDWGTNSIDDYAPNTWRTLTGDADGDEWSYLIKERSKKFGMAMVAGVGGMIILPDEFTDPNTNTAETTAFKPYVYHENNWLYNVYTAGASWDAMENAGAVFLPAGGTRRANDAIQAVGATGYYWSSYAYDVDAAYKIYFNNNDYWVKSGGYRYHGNSVRLVRDL